MSWKDLIIGMVTVAMVPAGLLAAGAESPEQGLQSPEDDDPPVFADLIAATDGQPQFLLRGQSPDVIYGATAIRFGWWATETSGSLVKVGEYQDPHSSPFFDVDHLSSDGCQTLDFSITGTDNESNQADVYYYRPGLRADIEYDRFLRRLDHDPLDNFNDPNAGFPAQDPAKFQSDDLDVGADYAIRVQKLDARFKGQLTENIGWRLNLWGMRKQGERQAHAMSQCYAINPAPSRVSRCHILSQGQRIDWVTMEIEPVIEAKFGALTVEYSRTMRTFNQDDQLVFRPYNTGNGSHSGWLLNGSYPYGIVPESFTQIDRLKFGADLTCNTHLYSNLFVGNSENKFRDVNRHFSGFDVRVTNRSIDRLTLTAYAKRWEENNRQTDTLRPEEDPLQGGSATVLHELIDRTRTTVGVKGRYLLGPRSYSSRGLALTGGYEHRAIDREHTEPENTTHNIFRVGLEKRWSPWMDSFLRYKMVATDDPLYAEGPGPAQNTNQPLHQDLVEIGGTWMPGTNFLLSASFGIHERNNHSEVANFDEESYPIVVTAWYAPTCRWSLSAGYAYFTNWITQDITMGQSAAELASGTQPWDFEGESYVWNVGTRYALTERLTLSGDVEYGRGRNTINPLVSPAPYAGLDASGDPVVITPDWSGIPGLMNVLAETSRLSLGVDYWIRDGLSCYFRYNYFDYGDDTGPDSGTANMFLAGFTALR